MTLPHTWYKKFQIIRNFLLVLIVIANVFMPATVHAATQPYEIKQYANQEQSVLFILQPDQTNQESANTSRRNLEIFRQIISSYWRLISSLVEVGDYTPNMSAGYDVVVLVDEYGETLPQSLVSDITALSGKEFIHFGLGGDDLLNTIGISARQLTGPATLDSVTYKGVTLNGGPYAQDIEYTYTGQAQLPVNTAVHVPFMIRDNQNNELPGALRVTIRHSANQTAGYLFFPFTLPRYYDTQSYTNAMLDVLHKPFGDIMTYPKQALVRLEDVNAYTYALPKNPLLDAYQVLKRRDIPFHIAYIERYIDPHKSIDTTAADHRHFAYHVQKMVAEGNAVLVQHGYTHQYQQEVSAIGFEFWDSQFGIPAADDSPEYARDRALQAQAGMRRNDLPVPDIWETPHYALGPQADKVFNELYPLRYEYIRGVGSLPFPVLLDGTIYIPETLDYLDAGWNKELPEFKQRLERLQVFRNAIPSFFWHPWRDTHELETLVDLLQNQGYSFVSAYDLLQTTSPDNGVAALQAYRAAHTDNRAYHTINAGVLILYIILILGVFRYLYDSYRFRKYFKKTLRFNQSLADIRRTYQKHKKQLPTFVIFVPARNEGLVITNTINNLAKLDYPKRKYQVVVITDQRELQDDVPVLTKDVVIAEAKRLNKKHRAKLVTYIEVPEYYSGDYKSKRRTYEKSTKGRALNYALQTHRLPKSWKKVDFIGVLDADGRLNQHVLKEAALESLQKNAQILQGPVYQVSNLSKVSIVGVMAGLELARFHLTNMLPRLMHQQKIQFLAGTNYFITRSLLDDVRGWDQRAMVEDAELALRVYTKSRLVASALTLPEVEQTPASFKIYRKQRERWARGYFEILDTVLYAHIPFVAKITFIRKILVSQLRFVLDLTLPVIALFFLIMGYLSEVEVWMQNASVILLICLVFIWDAYGQTYWRMVAYADKPGHIFARLWMRCKLFVFMPAFIVIQAIPRIDALYKFLTRKKIVWAKTERTAEEPALPVAARSTV